MARVSVVVPNYNHQRFLRRRIESILEQTYQDFELILLDDASTDDSVRILEKYRDDPRITIVVNEANSGSPFPQWNRGVQLACCEYVWIAEADDDAEPELLESLVRELDSDPAVVLAYCQSWIIDEQGNRLCNARSWTDRFDKVRWTRNFHNKGSEEARRYLVLGNTIPNASAVVFRRSAFIAAGGAPTSMRLCGDLMMWVALALRGDIAFVSKPLNCFRQHSGTVRASTSSLRLLHEWLDVLVTIETHAGIPHELRQELAHKFWHRWRSEFWDFQYPVTLSGIWRTGSFLTRMDRATGMRFLFLFSLRKAIGPYCLRVLRRLWHLFKRWPRILADDKSSR